MKFYLAARYSRNEEMRAIRDALVSGGHEVTSRWIDLHIETGSKLKKSFTPDYLAKETEFCSIYGQADVDDIIAADAVISFTSLDGGGKGGRHVEFGLAIGSGKKCYIVGPRENIFHTLPQVLVYQYVETLLSDLGIKSGSLQSAGDFHDLLDF